MTLLAGKLYDPAAQQFKTASAALAMQALDTTNLRLAFTVPANGAVLVRLRVSNYGSTTAGGVMLGVLEGSTVKGRVYGIGNMLGTGATIPVGTEALFVVPGLTPAANLTWDAAFGCEQVVSGLSLTYGGPNDATANNANGAVSFEIYDCANLLGAILYDPATLATKATSAALAMTALDTTNLRITFTAPASGNVLVRMRCVVQGATTYPRTLLGVLDGSTVRGRVPPAGGISGAAANSSPVPQDATFVVTGLTPSSSYTWDAAYGVEVLIASTAIKYGGPNNATANDAWGAFQYEIWAV